MENKRLTNKLNSWFWAILTALPLILFLIVYICGVPQCAKHFDWVNLDWYDFIDEVLNWEDSFKWAFAQFDNFSIPFIHNTFNNLFSNTFNLSSYHFVVYLFSWALSVQVYHLIYDVLKFIIEWCHNLIERGVN